ncbi:MAG: hypothetical protein KDJ38_04120 [Gammaproteobacteria bacterium]|nr:hypothetical protein [Gammaproteobacteria bacterium]
MRKVAPFSGTCRLLDRAGVSGSVGLIVLATDLTSERDFRRLMQTHQLDFDLYVNRIRFDNPVTETSLRSMESDLADVAAQILPACPLDIVAFACTSASALIGDDAVTQAIRRGKPGVRVITTAAASSRSLAALGKRKISVLTPYSREVSLGLTDYFGRQGLDIVSLTYLDVDDDRDIARISPETIMQAALEATAKEAEALFISCTALRAVEMIEAIQERIGKPVISSNQATFWQTVYSLEQTSKPV